MSKDTLDYGKVTELLTLCEARDTSIAGVALRRGSAHNRLMYWSAGIA